ncbi:retrovirus-related pol polyprotein from transposon TNT 1-94 [Tanacetum coccineum]
MKDPECVNHKVKIAPPDYSKKNYLAAFTQQKQLTPEQIFWSQDLIKMKEEALKKQLHLKTNALSRIARFTKMHDAHTIVKARCLELEAELSNLHDKIQKDNHNELLNGFPSEITRTKHIEQTTALLTENENLKAQIHENLKCNTIQSAKPRVLALGSIETLREIVEEAKVERPLDRSTVFACRYTKHSQELLEYAISTCSNLLHLLADHKHRSNTRKNRISPALKVFVYKKKVEEHPRSKKSQIKNIESYRTDRPLLDSGMTTFGADVIGVMRGRLVIRGVSVISRVYYVEGLGHNLFSVGQFYDLIWKHVEVLSNLLVVQSLQEQIMVVASAFKPLELWYHQCPFPRTPQHNGVVERQNRTLAEAARTMLIFSKAPVFLWAEAVATACYTQNRSLIHTRHCKNLNIAGAVTRSPDLNLFQSLGLFD